MSADAGFRLCGGFAIIGNTRPSVAEHFIAQHDADERVEIAQPLDGVLAPEHDRNAKGLLGIFETQRDMIDAADAVIAALDAVGPDFDVLHRLNILSVVSLTLVRRARKVAA